MKVLNVLVAEDNTINQKLLVALLKRMGHTGVLVENGEQALRCLEHNKIDLILMDDTMPVMTGLQALDKIRQDEKAGKKRMPVVMCTANDLPEDRDRYLRAGADGYLAKPINFEKLTHEIRQVLDFFAKRGW